MPSTSSVSIQGQTGAQVATGYDAFSELDTKEFLNLIIAELQSQDPMNPTDTSDMLNQFNQIREIASNDKLTKTLEGVLLGQNMATAGSLIGKLVEGLTKDSTKIIGQVDAVMVDNGEPSLLVAGKYMSLGNVLQIIDPELIKSPDGTAEEGADDAVDDAASDSAESSDGDDAQ
ncbi:MAG: flagellar hook capping FlgD N-terminal domain-containing protein [Thermoguttaceae bacterium]